MQLEIHKSIMSAYYYYHGLGYDAALIKHNHWVLFKTGGTGKDVVHIYWNHDMNPHVVLTTPASLYHMLLED